MAWVSAAIIPSSWYLALGFFPVGKIAIRADLLERLLANVRQLSRDGPFNVNSNMMNTIGVNEEKFTFILKSFGYVVIKKDKLLNVSRKKSGKRTSNKLRKQKTVRAVNSDSPFAILAKLKTGPQS